MSTTVARPLLHALHTLTFAVLLGTGLLIYLPELRAAVTGGYSQWIRSGHRWAGVAFGALPLLVVAIFGPRAVFAPPARHTARTRWQGLHTVATVAIGVAFAASGFILWNPDSVSIRLLDASQTVHEWLAYTVTVLLGLHLVDVAAATVTARLHRGNGAPP